MGAELPTKRHTRFLQQKTSVKMILRTETAEHEPTDTSLKAKGQAVSI
jgi:hypothetical protein